MNAPAMYSTECRACDGTGEIVFATWEYEPGCGFGHHGSDARACERCGGQGQTLEPFEEPDEFDLLDHHNAAWAALFAA